jgi:hypothetical protein
LKCCNAASGIPGAPTEWVCAAEKGGICWPGQKNCAAVVEMVV